MCWRFWSDSNAPRRNAPRLSKPNSPRAETATDTPPEPRLVNTRTGDVIAERVQVASGFFAQLVGLIALSHRGPLPGDLAMALPHCKQVHTFGLREAIDAVFCDKDGRVLHRETLAPRHVSRYVSGATVVYEMRAGGLAEWHKDNDVLKCE